MKTRTFNKQYLKDVLYEEIPGLDHTELTDTTRWSTCHAMVFKADDGLFYEANYSRGATECQDETPFEYSDQEVVCRQVHQVEKKILVWEEVE